MARRNAVEAWESAWLGSMGADYPGRGAPPRMGRPPRMYDPEAEGEAAARREGR